MGTRRWDENFLRMAQTVAKMSKDPSTKVGAVVTRGKEVVSLGYNGFPSGIKDDDRLQDRDRKYELVIHAEMNAILRAGRDAAGATLYLTLPPCSQCAKHILAAGIARVVWWGGMTGNAPERWVEDLALARDILAEGGVAFGPALAGPPV